MDLQENMRRIEILQEQSVVRFQVHRVQNSTIPRALPTRTQPGIEGSSNGYAKGFREYP